MSKQGTQNDSSLKRIFMDDYVKLLRMGNKNDANTLMIWGIAGLGKTTAPIQVAEEDGIQCKILAVAQLTEPGDLMGLPSERDLFTTYLPPDFLPRNGEGIFIIDDVNRANTMILQALLHFTQFREFGDYVLPKGWRMVLTGNVDDGTYIVNEIDDAFKTRFKNYELQFERKLWGKWARANGVEERFITFLLKNPEYVSSRNNPRAFTKGFTELKGTEDYSLIELVMGGYVPGIETILVSWLEKEWGELKFDSEDVYDLKKQEKLLKIFSKAGEDGKTLFAERLSTLNVKSLEKTKKESLRNFLHKMKEIDRERFMISFIPINKDNPDITDDELFDELV